MTSTVKIVHNHQLFIACTDDAQCRKLAELFLIGTTGVVIREVECEVEDLRLIGHFVLVNGVMIDCPNDVFYNDGACVVTRQDGPSDIVRSVKGMVLYEDGTLTYGNHTIQGVHDFTLYPCAISRYAPVVLDSGELRIAEHNDDKVTIAVCNIEQPPNLSIFACCVGRTLLSVSNDGELSFRDILFGEWTTAPTDQFGVVHELGYICRGEHTSDRAYVLFDNHGLMQLRNVSERCFDVVGTHVHSVSTLHRPKYKRKRVKCAGDR